MKTLKFKGMQKSMTVKCFDYNIKLVGRAEKRQISIQYNEGSSTREDITLLSFCPLSFSQVDTSDHGVVTSLAGFPYVKTVVEHNSNNRILNVESNINYATLTNNYPLKNSVKKFLASSTLDIRELLHSITLGNPHSSLNTEEGTSTYIALLKIVHNLNSLIKNEISIKAKGYRGRTINPDMYLLIFVEDSRGLIYDLSVNSEGDAVSSLLISNEIKVEGSFTC